MTKLWLVALLFLSSEMVMSQSLTKGVELYQSGNLKAAKDFFSQYDDNEKALYYLGRIAFDQEEYSDAADYFEDVIEINDQVADYYTWLGNSIGSYAGDVNFFKQGILAPQIKSAYEKAVALDPKSIDALFGLIEYYTQAPGLLGGSMEKAEETAHKIKQIDVLQGHSALATVYERQEAYDKAEQEYLAAVKADPKRQLNLGFFYQRQEKFGKAFSAFESAYNNDPTNLNALYQIGRTSALSGEQPEKGISSLNKFLEVPWQKGTPSHAGAMMRLAMIYEKSGNKIKAISLYEESLEKDPDMSEAKKGLDRLR